MSLIPQREAEQAVYGQIPKQLPQVPAQESRAEALARTQNPVHFEGYFCFIFLLLIMVIIFRDNGSLLKWYKSFFKEE